MLSGLGPPRGPTGGSGRPPWLSMTVRKTTQGAFACRVEMTSSGMNASRLLCHAARLASTRDLGERLAPLVGKASGYPLGERAGGGADGGTKRGEGLDQATEAAP